MKLNLKLTELNQPKPLVPVTSPYSSPIGWWKVTTEGDCEGRTTEQLGQHYGHVAEIAFHLADKSCYKLMFAPVKGLEQPPGNVTYVAKKHSVWISLDVDSNTWGMSADQRAKWFEKWLNVTDPKIECKGSYGGATYYAGCHLKLV
jgi:hypothetical protein